MGCRNDYPDPNYRELESIRVCRLLIYALPKMGRAVPLWVTDAAKATFGNSAKLDEATEMLCSVCRDMPEKLQNIIIYNGRMREARQLADWYDEHLKLDEEREKEDKKAALEERIKQKALSKLTKKERELLGL